MYSEKACCISPASLGVKDNRAWRKSLTLNRFNMKPVKEFFLPLWQNKKTEGNIQGLFIMIEGFIRKHHRRCAWCCTCDWIRHQNTPAESARLLQLVRVSLCLRPVPLNCSTEVRSEWKKIAMFSLSLFLSSKETHLPGF